MSHDIAVLKTQFPGLHDAKLHYLDNAATTQMPEAVFDALWHFDTHKRANVHGGVHRLACQAISAYEAARASVARLLNAAAPGEIVFTSGATASINLLAATFSETLRAGDEIVLSHLEHHSNLIPWQSLAARRDAVLKFIPVTADGRLAMEALESTITGKCRLVALTHCSNVTGAITDLGPVVRSAHAVGAAVMIDGAQQAPHGPVDVRALDVDFYAFSGHKVFGPTGIGVLWGRAERLSALPPFMTGGQMARSVTLEHAEFSDPPQRFEAGTPPIAGAIGLGAAAEWVLRQDWDAIRMAESSLTGRILDGLARMPNLRVLGPTETAGRRGVVSFAVEGMDPMALCQALDAEYGVAARYGDHCAQPLMRAFGVSGAVRVSLAAYNDDSDIDAFLDGLDTILKRETHK
jgi:cysteine desulfurase/selenocysteine lyase